MCLHCLGNFAKVRKVMMATTATMIVLNVVIPLLLKILYLAAGTDSTDRGLSPILAFLDLVDLAVWVTYLVYMSGVLNRLPKGRGYKVLGAELFRIFGGFIIDTVFRVLQETTGPWYIWYAGLWIIGPISKKLPRRNCARNLAFTL